MVTAIDITFEPLPIRKRMLVPVDANQYSVTDSARQTKRIQAATAYEAFKLSGFTDAIKIERVSNLSRPLLAKDQFTDEAPEAAQTDKPVSEGDALLRNTRRKLIISANDLDALMHQLQEIAARAPVPAPAPPSAPVTVTMVEGAVPGPTGMDVHGEGFDEIIPSSPAAKPAALHKPAEAKPASAAAPADAPAAPIPERELSQAEIEKLLGGK